MRPRTQDQDLQRVAILLTMKICAGLTVEDLINKARNINCAIGSGRKERHYQKCLDVELRAMGIPTAMEDPVPVYYQGEMVWQGRADLIIGRCCVELKAINKPPSAAGRQLQDYIRQKNTCLIRSLLNCGGVTV
jgi:GxxExxY protein